MPQIKINGLNIQVATEGQGRDVVLLHGWRPRMIMMEPIYNHLKAHFRVFNFDFPGFGKSDEPPVAWGVPEYREFLEAFCQTFDIHDPILIGHSFGCRVAVHYAVKNPVHKMVLTGAAGIRPKQTWQAKLKIAGYKAAKRCWKTSSVNPVPTITATQPALCAKPLLKLSTTMSAGCWKTLRFRSCWSGAKMTKQRLYGWGNRWKRR